MAGGQPMAREDPRARRDDLLAERADMALGGRPRAGEDDRICAIRVVASTGRPRAGSAARGGNGRSTRSRSIRGANPNPMKPATLTYTRRSLSARGSRRIMGAEGISDGGGHIFPVLGPLRSLTSSPSTSVNGSLGCSPRDGRHRPFSTARARPSTRSSLPRSTTKSPISTRAGA